ncbi:jg1139 [Pararge aegeria aegeria]|uniref:Jg1139 protein n=1 Tax=Pararge aegeria aegeria TaxID=348720 RepID=A0A8S4QZ37_9NEOP|nr:jg1139 [Pararge aegeria aegeria]
MLAFYYVQTLTIMIDCGTGDAPPTLKYTVGAGSALVDSKGELLIYPGSSVWIDCLWPRDATQKPEWNWSNSAKNHVDYGSISKLQSSNLQLKNTVFQTDAVESRPLPQILIMYLLAVPVFEPVSRSVSVSLLVPVSLSVPVFETRVRVVSVPVSAPMSLSVSVPVSVSLSLMQGTFHCRFNLIGPSARSLEPSAQ